MKGPMWKLMNAAMDHPRKVVGIVLAVTAVLAALAAMPHVWPRSADVLHPVRVDTDPENMLPHDDPDRTFHDRMRKAFDLYDIVVLGVVREDHPDGVFTPKTLENVHRIIEHAKSLRWDLEEPHTVTGNEGGSRRDGVIPSEIIAPGTVDDMRQGSPGTLVFEWLMKEPPKTPEEAREVRKRAQRLPMLDGTMVSEDGKALAIYLPLTRKDLSHRVAQELEDEIEKVGGQERYYITGLPVAEDTFGVQMFEQMAIAAPMATSRGRQPDRRPAPPHLLRPVRAEQQRLPRRPLRSLRQSTGARDQATVDMNPVLQRTPPSRRGESSRTIIGRTGSVLAAFPMRDSRCPSECSWVGSIVISLPCATQAMCRPLDLRPITIGRCREAKTALRDGPLS